jgi:hypothetical protein
LYSIYPTGFGIQKASEARVDQIWSGLHSHFDTSAIAVPPHNRSKGMVNHLDMWDKGAKMLQVGVSRQFIGHSLAIELAIDPVQRQFQLDANQALIQQADGGLAPMTGQERFLTIYEVLMCFYHCFCFFQSCLTQVI